MTTQHSVDNFLQCKSIAVVGVSRDKRKFGYAAYKELRTKRFSVYPVNPNLSEVDSVKCYPNLSSINDKLDGVLLVIPPNQSEQVVKEAYQLGIRSIWFQQGSSSKEAEKFCRDKGISYVSNECVLMFAEPIKPFHKFHRLIWKVFGKLPA